MRSLNGLSAVVTGASLGIGRAVAISLAREGCRVALVARNLEGLEETASKMNGMGVIVQADLSKNSSIQSAVQSIASQLGQVDIVWNGAFGWLDGKFEDASISDIGDLIDSSVRGPLLLTRELMPLLLKSPSPHIINVAADWEFPATEGLATFIAAKRAIAGFGIALQKEGDGRLRITNLHPADVASKDGGDVDETAASVSARSSGALVSLQELTQIVIFILKLEGAIVHGITIKPLRQSIAHTYIQT